MVRYIRRRKQEAEQEQREAQVNYWKQSQGAITRDDDDEEATTRTSGSTSFPYAALHPALSEAGRMLSNGHRAAAVREAYIVLDNHVRDKARLTNKDGSLMTGSPLMMKAFSRGGVLSASKDEHNQDGFMYLFAGAIIAVRNNYAHNRDADPGSTERAFEWLAFASALLRIVDVGSHEVGTLS